MRPDELTSITHTHLVACDHGGGRSPSPRASAAKPPAITAARLQLGGGALGVAGPEPDHGAQLQAANVGFARQLRIRRPRRHL
jgi:hypothetical protein